MFNPDFYPTPNEVIIKMLEGTEIEGKIILEPSAGKGNIIDYLNFNGAEDVLFCEINEDLKQISQNKGIFLTDDFLKLESSQISHVDLIIMNPPFSADEKHILHAYEIAPKGCKIIALCNANTFENAFSQQRKELKTIVKNYGTFESLGSCFEESERKTGVEIGLIKIIKEGASYSTEFEGFFMGEDEEEPQENALMSYNVVRDLVNRYVDSIKIFDKQLEEAQRMNDLTSGYFSVKDIAMSITSENKPLKRSEFKKEMQKSGWKFIFNKMNLTKFTTKGLTEDINKFVEEQTNVPFTMRNIYKMLELVINTTGQRMDKAILEVFDKVTMHYHENRYNVEGWKTNSHYLLNKKFIFPNLVEPTWSGKGITTKTYSSDTSERIDDLVKALCFLTGENYDDKISFKNFIYYTHKVKKNKKYLGYSSYFNSMNEAGNYISRLEQKEGTEIEHSEVIFGEWIEWTFFRIKCFKKGTVHFEFLDSDLWGRFNQRVAELKGYPLFEKAPDKRTERQKEREKQASQEKVKPTILKTFKFKETLFD